MVGLRQEGGSGGPSKDRRRRPRGGKKNKPHGDRDGGGAGGGGVQVDKAGGADGERKVNHDDLCLNCHQAGHWALDCPHPRRRQEKMAAWQGQVQAPPSDCMAEPSLGASQPCMVTRARARARRLSTTQSAYLISVISMGRDKQELRRKNLPSCSAVRKAPGHPLYLPCNPSSHHIIELHTFCHGFPPLTLSHISAFLILYYNK